jgi:hypothetical protein
MTRDFNLMLRRGRGSLRVLAAADALLPAPQTSWLGLFTAHGGQLSHGGRTMALQPMSLAWCETPVAQRCEFVGRVGGGAWWMAWTDDQEEEQTP